MLNILRKIIPRPFFKLYHYLLAIAANFFYRSPSDDIIVIGVTGTSGKSTVVYLISQIFEQAGFKVGAASTIFFKVAKEQWLNDKKMTMIGRLALQKMIRQMVKANCQFAIIETTSQGIAQFRHLGINYDVLVFTNLYPEHIEAHGGFDNYKKAKLKLFKRLAKTHPKLIAGEKIKKTIIANLDDEHSADFLNHWAEVKYGFTTSEQKIDKGKTVSADKIKVGSTQLEFEIENHNFNPKLLGNHNVSNCLAAITVGLSQGLSLPTLSKALAKVKGIPGRIEFIEQGQNFKIIVDYAFEPKALTALYDIVQNISHQKIIHILGSAGGGRDVARRSKIGELAGVNADVVIITNEDPYDEDPQKIINQVAAGAIKSGKGLDQDLFKILDRRQAITMALKTAQKNDLVLITGKGSEQAIVVSNNKKVPWDDREVVKEELKNIN